MRTQVILLSFAVILATNVCGSEPPHKKVLLIGIDGCRFDALLYSQAKHLKELVRIGVLKEMAVSKEKLFLHPKLMRLLTREGNTVTPYR